MIAAAFLAAAVVGGIVFIGLCCLVVASDADDREGL